MMPMIKQNTSDGRGHVSMGEASRTRLAGTSLAQLVLSAALIVSIVAILTVFGASATMAATRADLIIFEEGTRFSVVALLTLILVVMAVLTVLALRNAGHRSRKSVPARRR